MSGVSNKVEYSEEYKRGYETFEKGGTRKDCPYIRSSTSWDKWVRGYEDAYEDEHGDTEPV